MGKRGEVGWEPCYLHPPKSTKSLSGKHLRRICVIRSRLPGPRAACSRQTETQTPWTNRRAQGAKSGTLVLQEERRRKGQVTVTSDSKGVRRSLEGAQALGSQAQVRVCACAHVHMCAQAWRSEVNFSCYSSGVVHPLCFSGGDLTLRQDFYTSVKRLTQTSSKHFTS